MDELHRIYDNGFPTSNVFGSQETAEEFCINPGNIEKEPLDFDEPVKPGHVYTVEREW